MRNVWSGKSRMRQGETVDGLPPAAPMLPGALLTDPSWLGERVDQTGRQFRCTDRRTNATLWWYSASVVLLGPAVQALVHTGSGLDLSPSGLRFTLLFNGYLERVVAGGPVPDGPSGFGRHLDDALGLVIAPLARVGEATEQALWAIAADSLATRVLAETSVHPAGTAAAPRLASAVAETAGRLRPAPRFVDVQGRADAPPRRYVRRGSCCLLYRVPDGLCISCPKQTPVDRQARLQQHARAVG